MQVDYVLPRRGRVGCGLVRRVADRRLGPLLHGLPVPAGVRVLSVRRRLQVRIGVRLLLVRQRGCDGCAERQRGLPGRLLLCRRLLQVAQP